MPLRLVPPNPARRWTNYRIRGTYLGVRVDRTTGTPEIKVAKDALRAEKRAIECGAHVAKGEPTFADAALAYVKAGGEDLFLEPLTAHFGTTPLRVINQAAIDAAALQLCPNVTNASRNRKVYTPMSAILNAYGVSTRWKRPKGAQGKRRTFFFTPDQAERILLASCAIDTEFAILCAFLLYAGCRLNEGLDLPIDRLNLSEAWAWVSETKNGEPRMVHLPPPLVAILAQHPRGLNRPGQPTFRFKKCGRLYTWFNRACGDAGVTIPPRVAFHAFRHTWGAWMRRYGGLDTTGLVETGAWKSRASAAVYEHAVQSEEARRADLLPALKIVAQDVRSSPKRQKS